jgi:uncharacterized membrane protein YkoI
MQTKAKIVLAGLAAVVALPLAGSLVMAQQQKTEDADKAQEPTYSCSIKVPQGTKDQDLATLAKIPLPRATQMAQAAVSGMVKQSGLENENGCLVYSVDIQSADGKFHDVKVDAGTGAVVHQETSAKQGTEREGPGEVENGKED